jgi:hypothetical protein
MAEVKSTSAIDILELDSDTHTTLELGDMADISHLFEISWYKNVWYIDQLDPLQNKKLVKYLGPSHEICQAMCSRLMTLKGKEISQ